MATFEPPTVPQAIPGNDRLYGRYMIDVAQSVVLRDGHYVTVPIPWLGEIYELEEGVEYFIGGHVYTISGTVASALLADGYTTT